MLLKSPFRFIIEPLNGNKYINEKQFGNSTLTINTSIESAADVQRIGVVKQLPEFYDGDVRIGDLAIVQHNVFRITLNDKGFPMNSNCHIVDDLYYVDPELLYMVIRNGKKIAVDNNVFIEPVFIDEPWIGLIEHKHVGILRYPNKFLQKQGLKDGQKIIFRKGCEYEFIIDGERLYKMANHRILSTLN